MVYSLEWSYNTAVIRKRPTSGGFTFTWGCKSGFMLRQNNSPTGNLCWFFGKRRGVFGSIVGGAMPSLRWVKGLTLTCDFLLNFLMLLLIDLPPVVSKGFPLLI